MLTIRSLLMGLALPSALAAAQPMASITITANGGASVIAQPGEPIAIAAVFADNQFSFAAARGSTIVTDNAGYAGEFWSVFPALPTVNYGHFLGGSRVGGDFALQPPGFLGANPGPPVGLPSFAIWRYTVTLDEPGLYRIDWVPDPAFPDLTLYASIGAFAPTTAQSTYVGATITIVPAPASASAVLLITLAPRRKRRPRQSMGAITC